MGGRKTSKNARKESGKKKKARKSSSSSESQDSTFGEVKNIAETFGLNLTRIQCLGSDLPVLC